MTKIDHWKTMIDEIHLDSYRAFSDHRVIYKGYVEIVNASTEEVRSPFDFHDFVIKQHGIATALFIRRQLDTKNISMYRLLSELINKPELINLEWFESLYGEEKGYAKGDFEQFTNDGFNFDYKVAEKDRKRLTNLGKKIDAYVDMRIAHRALQAPLQVTYNEIDEFLNEFEEILKKYLLLLEGVGYISIAPTYQYDVFQIFNHKWIKK